MGLGFSLGFRIWGGSHNPKALNPMMDTQGLGVDFEEVLPTVRDREQEGFRVSGLAPDHPCLLQRILVFVPLGSIGYRRGIYRGCHIQGPCNYPKITNLRVGTWPLNMALVKSLDLLLNPKP